MSSSVVRSPFVDRVINLLPQGHDEAIKQAFYNIAIISLFTAVGSAGMAVYFILQPFVKPLLWAILIGSVLHPIKQHSVFLTHGWLSNIYNSNSLLVFGLLTVPLKAVDFSVEWMGTTIQRNLKLLLSLSLGVPVIIIIQQNYSSAYIVQAYDTLINAFYYFGPIFELNSLNTAVTFLVGSLGVALTLSSNFKLQVIFNFFWLLVFLMFFYILGSLKVILIAVTLLLVAIALAIHCGWIAEGKIPDSIKQNEALTGSMTTPQPPRKNIVTKARSAPKQTTSPKSNNRYIYGAIWCCLAVQLWRHVWLLHLFPIPLVCYAVKSIGSYLNIWSFLHGHQKKLKEGMSSWFISYKDQIFPMPLQWMFKAVVYLDHLLIKKLMSQVDAVVTVVIICVVVVSTILASVFLAIQIYGESVHLVQFGTRVVNQTMTDPYIKQWLPQGIDQLFGSVFDNAYSYGKTGIATLVKNTIHEKDPIKAAQIELVITQALDKIQGTWQAQNQSITSKLSHTQDAADLKDKPPLLRRLSQDFLNVSVLANFCRENVGMIFSILDSVWNLLKGNLSLVIKSTTAIVSVLMGGGTAILNFLVNGVVFLTALYYLLVASDTQYKPIQLLSVFSPTGGNRLGTAMEEAINTVCMASLKLAAFYGLWTWLIHTVFQVNFVVIPAALAALLGGVPFLGTYWAALPAALDLWLAQGRGVEAIFLMLFQISPTLLVDAAFYAEIKGGGHPYLTGLAVAGGIFWLGFEGAIIGPLLLCVLLVAVSIYSSLVQDSQSMDTTPRWFHRRLLRTDTVG